MKKSRLLVSCPSDDEISNAISVLSQQTLHFYQLLYFKGLSSPYGNPFKVERHIVSSGLTTIIKILPNGHEEYAFYVRNSDDDETVLKKVKLIQDALESGKEKIDGMACCPLAERRNCVCVASFECPIHGNMCVGSHD